MILVALTLIATGLLAGLLGFKLFRVLLPLMGLVGGSVVGFVGFQTLFGTGVVSTTVAVFVAVVVGFVLALLSFLYFKIAVVAYTALLGASVFSFLGAALGFAENGFILTLLSISGIAIGIIIATQAAFSERLIVLVTAFLGAALILEGLFLIFGNVNLEQLHEQGAIASVIAAVDQSFLWLFVWLAGGIAMAHFQTSILVRKVLDDQFQFELLESKR